MPKTKVEVYDKDQLIYPFIESDHVTFSNGMKITEMLDQSISMPKVTHEDSSFKVGVGDQDVSSAIVDSSVAEMTIKGQTYQNILPEPTLRNEMQGKSMQRLNEGYDSIETVDGVSKSAILKGNTLVNLLERFQHGCSYDSETGIYTSTQNEWVEPARVTQNVKANVSYTLFAKVNTTSDYIYVRLDYMKGNIAKDSIINGNVTPNTDIFIKTVVQFSTEDGVRFVLRNAHDGVVKMSNIMLIEGDYSSQDIPFFEGMTSCKMPVLKSTGKNLFNHVPESLIGKTSNGMNVSISDGKIRITGTPTGTFGYVEIVKCVEKGKKYTFSAYENGQLATSGYRLWVRYSDGTLSNPVSGGTFVVKNLDIVRVEFVFEGFTVGTAVNKEVNIQIEESPSPTPYEPYKSNILSCQLAPLNQSMFEQGTFAETTPPNTQSYEQIKLGSEHLYTTRIRTKGTYKVVKGATYEVRLNDGYDIYVCYCKNGLYSATVNRWLDGTSTFTVPNDCDEMFFAIRKTDNTAIAPSDYPLIGLKIHQEVILRSLPNDTKDTLNLNTGEYVQRIGEVTLNGSEEWAMDNEASDSKENTSIFYSQKFTQFKKLEVSERNSGIVCNNYPVKGDVYGSDVEGMMFNHVNVFYFRVKKSVANNVGDFKQWLSQNPKEVQLELATPVIKTVDLSSSGNWEKVILDGKSSEDWKQNSHSGNFVQFEGYSNFCLYSMNLPVSNRGLLCDKLSYYGYDSKFRHTKVEGISDGGGYRLIFVRVKTEKLPTNDVVGFKQWLSQNPTAVWYQTTTTQDNSIREMLSFANGHIQVSSEAENSLLPSVQYEIPTKNSYHMDLMKTNTLYTMKAKSVSGTFTIDGTSYGVGTNGTFTTPTSMTNKLLIMSNKTNEEVMILEGDVTDKTIPYFKGIKSAFEDEDKIEVLSQGKNLIDETLWTKSIIEDGIECLYGDGWYSSSGNVGTPILIPVDIKQGKRYRISVTHKATTHFNNYKILQDCLNNRVVGDAQSVFILDRLNTFTESNASFVANFDAKYLMVDTGNPRCYGYIKKGTLIIEEVERDGVTTAYEPYKSNSTKIPLLHPLRSLPNGVCDELIIDRLNHKAKLVQRVGCVVLDGSIKVNVYPSQEKKDTLLIQTKFPMTEEGKRASCISDTHPHSPYLWTSHITEGIQLGGGDKYKHIDMRLSKTKVSSNDATRVESYLSKNPTTVLYELKTPIVTEIDLEGYPYAYKDGHIFLNSDIAPTTQITYSINQAQQIESANENLQRHEKEISHLQKLIAQYIQVEYVSTLLSLKL